MARFLGDEGFTSHSPERREGSEVEKKFKSGHCQWTIGDNSIFVPANRTAPIMDAGLYCIEKNPNLGVYFKKIPISKSNSIKFEQTFCGEIVDDIKKFWILREKYRQLGEIHKRGIILTGSQGTGKSQTIRLVVEDLISNGGIAIKFDNPDFFVEAMRILRQIEPEREVVCIMEDLDGFLEDWPESELLNILDGVDQVQHIVFLATTNYPEKLLGRVTNRPSRFDRRFEFSSPDETTRRIYLESLITKFREENEGFKLAKLDKWVKDTKTLSIAHIKELFISVVIFGYDYDRTLAVFDEMKKKVNKSDEEAAAKLGF